jgi:hypothetical protein
VGTNEVLSCLRRNQIPYGRHIVIFQIRVPLTTLALTLAFSANLPNASAQKALTADQTQIVDKVQTIFAAALTNDVAMLNRVVAPDFYIYDGGVRFNGDDILGLIKAQQSAGKRFEWKITEPDVHISGNTAWIAYVNQGRITDASFLDKQAGAWKIVFMHSTRVPGAAGAGQGK